MGDYLAELVWMISIIVVLDAHSEVHQIMNVNHETFDHIILEQAKHHAFAKNAETDGKIISDMELIIVPYYMIYKSKSHVQFKYRNL